MDISNKTLAMFLVAAIVVSIAGTVISLNKFGQIRTQSLTGFATSGTGNVTLSVNDTLSITLDDNDINFGNCVPTGGQHVNISSEVANGNAVSNNCMGFTPDHIIIRNDGNIAANVTFNVSKVGEADGGTLLSAAVSDASKLWYRISNSTDQGGFAGGCMGTFQSAWTAITSAAALRLGCDNLAYGSSDNSIQLDVRITLPYDATGSDFVEFYIWAEQA